MRIIGGALVAVGDGDGDALGPTEGETEDDGMGAALLADCNIVGEAETDGEADGEETAADGEIEIEEEDKEGSGSELDMDSEGDARSTLEADEEGCISTALEAGEAMLDVAATGVLLAGNGDGDASNTLELTVDDSGWATSVDDGKAEG